MKAKRKIAGRIFRKNFQIQFLTITLCRINIGEGFVTLPRESAIERVEKLQAKLDQKSEKIESDIASIKKELAALKVILYAKFKNSINLEED